MKPELNVSSDVLTALRRIIRAIDLHSRRLALRYGLTGPQLVLLQELARMPNASVGELAKSVSLSNGTVTDILDRLEKRGLVHRVRGDEDKRRVFVRITEAGGHIMSEAPPLLQEHFNEEFRKLKDWEQTLILSSLQRVASMMEEKASAAPLLAETEELIRGACASLDALQTESAQINHSDPTKRDRKTA